MVGRSNLPLSRSANAWLYVPGGMPCTDRSSSWAARSSIWLSLCASDAGSSTSIAVSASVTEWWVPDGPASALYDGMLYDGPPCFGLLVGRSSTSLPESSGRSRFGACLGSVSALVSALVPGAGCGAGGGVSSLVSGTMTWLLAVRSISHRCRGRSPGSVFRSRRS